MHISFMHCGFLGLDMARFFFHKLIFFSGMKKI